MAESTLIFFSWFFNLTLNDLRMQNGSREGVRQHLGLGLEDVADPFLIAGHAQGEFFITAATEFKELADLDLLKLKRG